MGRLLIAADHVVTSDAVLAPGVVCIEDAAIAHVGAGAPDGWEDAERIDGSGCVAIPGLVNAHTHSGMTLMRGVADDQPLMPWLEETIWPMEAQMTAEDAYWGASLGALEMLRAGVTSYADMYAFAPETSRAARDAGIRAVVGEALFGQRPGADAARETAVADIRASDPGDRVTLGLAPHALYTCPPDFLRRVAADAAALGTTVQIHVSETEGEVERCRAEHGGRSPVVVLDELGLLTDKTLAAHCVHLDADDIAILAERGTTVVHNPASNMKLGSGIAPVADLLEAGVEVALGTDSAASNNQLSLLNELRLAALLAKVGGDSTALPARQALELATHGNELARGALADVTLVRLDRLHTSPLTDPISLLAYSAEATDVDTVVVDGRVRVRGGELAADLDAERVRARCAEIIGRIRRGT